MSLVINNKFPLGRLLMSRDVNGRVAEDAQFSKFVLSSLRQHAEGDWGDMCQEDKQLNDLALRDGGSRIFSAYESPELPKIWIITEWNRSATTILFPDDY